MAIQYLVFFAYLVVLGIDILRVAKCARMVHLDRNDVTWLTMCFSGALAAILLIVGILFRYNVDDNASYFILAAVIFVWLSFTTAVINLLHTRRDKKQQTLDKQN